LQILDAGNCPVEPSIGYWYYSDPAGSITEANLAASFYYTAQVCLNGHATTSRLESSPELASNFCPVCGAHTISSCPKCNAKIRGDYEVPGIVAIGFLYTPPNYCHNCGQGLPWTVERIRAAETLAEEIEGLTPEERQLLKQSITELTSDSTRTELATVRYKRLVKKAGATIGPALNKIVVAIATEGAKKLLGL
jgi:hypothetical protein